MFSSWYTESKPGKTEITFRVIFERAPFSYGVFTNANRYVSVSNNLEGISPFYEPSGYKLLTHVPNGIQ